MRGGGLVHGGSRHVAEPLMETWKHWFWRQFVVGEIIGGGPAHLFEPRPPIQWVFQPLDRDDLLYPGDVKAIRARLTALESR